MRSILEKAIVHLLNEEHEQAEALFHKFMVSRARQIHESLRQGEDAVLEEGWDEEITSESYFTEDDLSDAEDAAGEDEAVGEFGADDFGGDEVDGAEGIEGDEFAADDIEGAADEIEDEFGIDGDEMGDEGDLRAEMDDLKAQIEALTAEFEAQFDGEGDEFAADDAEGIEGDEFAADSEDGEEFGDHDDFGVDGADDAADQADSMEDDMEDGDHVEESEEDFSDEDFDDITESIVSELEKISVSLTDGKEIGTGKSISQNNKSPALQKKPDVNNDGKPVQIKAEEHQGFERETAPAVKDMKKRKNNRSKAEDGNSTVSKEGNKSAILNKTPGAEAQTHSPLAKR